ncbi:DUF1415 domain-containing protein [Shewanella sp. NIFS-20-20]|uniref:DUF1415 domain-containing protein n=1 Tax=Shewanella sp. NIFS-20-20 TaxID=2853806 RepID=UPI001C487474|nr:DUF1415 domain-containing protein [Shewanella sp. NIFS-20-20]MBV7315130.1 DUF1415 domain-containing protein [Shewanella sp. NIFS-20-20]
MSEPNDVIIHTDNWVKRVIMKYNICPFARREVERNAMRYRVVEDTKFKAVLKQLIDECQYLDQHENLETSLFILPRGFEDFYTYLDLVDAATDCLAEQGYEGIYQLASFHPDYCFEGDDEQAAANYTNRAPYPTLHIIREASLEKALAGYLEPESIPQRNIGFCERKGAEFFRDLLAQCKKDGPQGRH